MYFHLQENNQAVFQYTKPELFQELGIYKCKWYANKTDPLIITCHPKYIKHFTLFEYPCTHPYKLTDIHIIKSHLQKCARRSKVV